MAWSRSRRPASIIVSPLYPRLRGSHIESLRLAPGAPGVGQTGVEAVAQLVGRHVGGGAPPPRDDDAGRGDARQPGEPEELPAHPHRSRRLRVVPDTALALDEAVATAATGDIWL